jgi:hypothetical protein
MAVTTEGSTVVGTEGSTVVGMAIHSIMIIVTINVAVSIVRHAIMVKVPLISILGGGSDSPQRDCAIAEKEQRWAFLKLSV